MGDLLFVVEVIENADNLGEDSACFILFETALPIDVVEEVAIRDHLHCDVKELGIFHNFKEGNDERVVNRTHERNFPL